MAVQSTRFGPKDRFALAGTTLDGKYRIDRVVAEGGFGVVYEGYHKRLRVPIALKVLKTLADIPEEARKAFATQFVREAQTTARIKHRNIVQVLDVGIAKMPSGESAAWMVLEWLTGRTLQEDLRARRGHGGRSAVDAMALLRPVIDAVAHAHDEGVAHRDLKPANIMLVETRRGLVAHVLDFGIAKAMEQDEDAGSGVTITRGTANAFSPNYAAPEQVAATRTGPWTDVHALGLMLTELLTDTAPYTANDKAELFSLALSPERPTPRKLGFDVGPIEPVLRKALAFRPDDRHRDAGELLADLDALIAPSSLSPSRTSGPGSPSQPVGVDAHDRGDSSPSGLRANSARRLDSEIPSGERGAQFGLPAPSPGASQPSAPSLPHSAPAAGSMHSSANAPAAGRSVSKAAFVAAGITAVMAAVLAIGWLAKAPAGSNTAPVPAFRTAQSVSASVPTPATGVPAAVTPVVVTVPAPVAVVPPTPITDAHAPAEPATTVTAVADDTRASTRAAPRNGGHSRSPRRATRHTTSHPQPDDDFRPR